jgi:hypothetical protein
MLKINLRRIDNIRNVRIKSVNNHIDLFIIHYSMKLSNQCAHNI